MKVTREEIISIIEQCYDPEIPVDLWNLGLIYSIDIRQINDEMSDIDILMTLTTPGCAMAGYMTDDVKNKVSSLKNVNDVEVQLTFDPQWQPEMMTDVAREKLGLPKTSI